jgi:hypothetical protein
MYQDNIITLKKPSEISNDPLLDILREGARSLLAEALETEITLFKEKYQQLRNRSSNRPLALTPWFSYKHTLLYI